MADSCRPVSRHGRYHATDRRLSSNVPYTEDVPSYSTVEYVDQDDVYGLRQSAVRMETMERPKSRKGRRTPPTPQGFDFSSDEEVPGRPVSRRGYTPERHQKHDYDEFSRQVISFDRQVSSDEDSNTPPPTSPMMGVSSYTSSMRKPPPAPRTPSRDSPYHVKPQMSPSARRRKLSGSQNTSPMPSPRIQQRPPSASKYGRSPRDHYDNSRYLGHDQTYSSEYDMYKGQSYTSPLQPRPPSAPKSRSNRPPSADKYDNGYRQEYEDKPQSGEEEVTSYLQQHEQRQQQRLQSRNPGYDSYDTYRPNNSPMGYGESDFPPTDYQSSHGEYDRTPTHHRERPTTGYKNRAKSSRAKSAKKRACRSAKKNSMNLSSEESVIDNLPSAAMMRPTSSLTRYKLLPAIGTPQPPSREDSFLSLQTSYLNIDDSSSQQLSFGEPSATPNSPISHELGPDHHITRPLYRSSSDLHSEDNSSQRNYDDTRLPSSDHNSETRKEDFSGDSMDVTDSVYGETTYFNPHKLPHEPTSDETTRILLAVRLPSGKREQRFFRVTDQMNVVLQFAENVSNCDLSAYNLACNIPRVVFTDLTELVGESGLDDKTVLYLQEK